MDATGSSTGDTSPPPHTANMLDDHIAASLALPEPTDSENGDLEEEQQEDKEEHDSDVEEDIQDVENQKLGKFVVKDEYYSFKAILGHKGSFLSTHMVPNYGDHPKVSIAFRLPQVQRASVVIRIEAPRLMDIKVNPGQIEYHQVQITAFARNLTNFDFANITEEAFESLNISKGDGFHNYKGEMIELATLDLSCPNFLLTGTELPPLATSALSTQLESLISDIRVANAAEQSTSFHLIIRRSGQMTEYFATHLSSRIHRDLTTDPIFRWIHDSPNVGALTMGNIKGRFKRPAIPIQQREYVFPDRLSYLVPHTYGLVYEEEFQEIILQELHDELFNAIFIECPAAINPIDETNDTADYLDTTATAYIVLVNYVDKTVTRPDVGTTVRVRLFATNEEDNEEEAAAGVEAGVVEAGVEVGTAPVDENAAGVEADVEVETAAVDEHEAIRRGELGDEEDEDVFAEEVPSADPLEWTGTIVEPTDVTPDGWVTILVERRRDQTFRGPRSQRPYVTTAVTSTNFRGANTEFALSNRIKATPTISVRLGVKYTKQGLKDQVRCNDQLWRGDEPQAIRLQNWLLAQDSTTSPLATVNVVSLKGSSSFQPQNFNASQTKWWSNLQHSLEVNFLHGGYGSGKTTMAMNVCLNALSNTECRHQILYTIENNQSVDDVALRLHALVQKHGLQKKIIRAHSLKGEKSQVYKYYDQQGQPQSRYAVSEALLNEFTTIAHLARISQHVQERRARGDPRRVLAHMSLAQSMYDALSTAPHLQHLHIMLTDYGRDGYATTTAEHRRLIKEGLNELLAWTIQQADVIVCTVAAAAKVNLYTNFDPVIVILDEAGRITEFKAATLFGCYSPRAFIFVGDPMQPGAYVATAGRERDVNPYINPFVNQVLLSMFSRLMATGHSHHLLTVQHRCRAQIHHWLSRTFYNNQVKLAPAIAADRVILNDIYNWGRINMALGTPTNRFMVNLDGARHEKESGGTSLFNATEVDHLVQDLVSFRRDENLGKLSVLVTSFYKAQVNKLKIAIRQHPRLQDGEISVMPANEVASKIVAGTVNGVQGHEYDAVFLSMVQTGNNGSFVNHGPRLLVALSRSRYMLSIYGSMALCRDAKWSHNNKYIKALFKDLEMQGHVVDRPVAITRTCHRCKAVGHLSNQCTEPRQDLRTCRLCGQSGHIASVCLNPPTCVRCRENGATEEQANTHVAKQCRFFAAPPRCN